MAIEKVSPEKFKEADLYNLENWSGINKLFSKYPGKDIWERAEKVYLLFLAEIMNRIFIKYRHLPGSFLKKYPNIISFMSEEILSIEPKIDNINDIFTIEENHNDHIFDDSGKIILQKTRDQEIARVNLAKIKDFLIFFLNDNLEHPETEKDYVEKYYTFLQSKIDLLYKSQTKPEIQENGDIGSMVKAWVENGGVN